MASSLDVALDGSQVLDNPNHERFCQLRASGKIKTDWEAYMLAYDCSKATAEDVAYRIAQNDGICRRMQWLQGQMAGDGIANKTEILRWLTSAMRTPVGQIDEQHTLAQEVTHESGEWGTRTKVKSVPKLGAVEQLSKLLGLMDTDTNSLTLVNVTVNGNA